MICDGRALPIDAYEPLYAVLGQSAAPRNPRTGRLLHGNPTHFYLPESGPLQFVIAVRGVAPTSPRVVNAVMAERRDQNPV
jgi:microcystin-dependent protein